MYAVRKQPEIADAKFRERKAELKIIAKKALRGHGTLANALRKGALPARYRTLSHFTSDLRMHDLSAGKIKQLYAIPSQGKASREQAVHRETRRFFETTPSFKALMLASNPDVLELRKMINAGSVHERKPPDTGLLFRVADAASYNAAVIAHALGINYSVLHSWLLKTGAMPRFDRGARDARAREEAQRAEQHAKRQELIKKAELKK